MNVCAMSMESETIAIALDHHRWQIFYQPTSLNGEFSLSLGRSVSGEKSFTTYVLFLLRRKAKRKLVLEILAIVWLSN